MTRDAELPTRRFVDLICNHAANEHEIVLLERLISQVIQIIDVYGDPTNRLAARRQVANTSRRNFAKAEPGSDEQLAGRGAPSWRSDRPEDLAEIASWLEVDETSGLRIDTDIRWAIIMRLAASGSIDEREIRLNSTVTQQISAVDAPLRHSPRDQQKPPNEKPGSD